MASKRSASQGPMCTTSCLSSRPCAARFKDKIFFTTDLDALPPRRPEELGAQSRARVQLRSVTASGLATFHSAISGRLSNRDLSGHADGTRIQAVGLLEPKTEGLAAPADLRDRPDRRGHLASPSVDDLAKWIKSGYSDGSAPPAEDTMRRLLGGVQKYRAATAAAVAPFGELLAIIWMVFLGTLSIALLSPAMQDTALPPTER